MSNKGKGVWFKNEFTERNNSNNKDVIYITWRKNLLCEEKSYLLGSKEASKKNEEQKIIKTYQSW